MAYETVPLGCWNVTLCGSESFLVSSPHDSQLVNLALEDPAVANLIRNTSLCAVYPTKERLIGSDLDCPGAQEIGHEPISETIVLDYRTINKLKTRHHSAFYSLGLDREDVQPLFGLISYGKRSKFPGKRATIDKLWQKHLVGVNQKFIC